MGLSDDKCDKKARVKVYEKHNLCCSEWLRNYKSLVSRASTGALGPKKVKAAAAVDAAAADATPDDDAGAAPEKRPRRTRNQRVTERAQ